MVRTRKRPSHARHTNRQAARVERQRQRRDEEREKRHQHAERQRERAAAHRVEPPRAQQRRTELTTAWAVADRYDERLAVFRAAFGDLGWWVHLAAWVLHNCVAHPLLGLFPGPRTAALHDATADWLNLRREPSRSPAPKVRVPWAWILHNCVAHPLMGVAPRARWFAFHDATAEWLGVDGWV